MHYFLFFLFLNVFSLQSQTDSVRLVDIHSSECGGMYYVEPYFLNKETVRDTTYISLSCSNNCSGYHNPKVTLSCDSVLISIVPGKVTNELKTLYRINGKLLDEREVQNLEYELYPQKVDRSDSSQILVATEEWAACDCCFTFELKVLGLDSAKQYHYFYNGEYIDTKYKPIESFELTNFFKQTEYETCQQVYQILSKKEELLAELNQDFLTIRLSVDTMNGMIKEINTNFDRLNEHQKINKKLKKYFYSISPIDCVTHPFEHRKLERYWVRFKLNQKSKELEMTYQLADKVIN